MAIPLVGVACVAPRVGAWIEIRPVGRRGRVTASHPVWVRGLKSCATWPHLISTLVAPRVGAWIEINVRLEEDAHHEVAPRVGAWIEIMTVGYMEYHLQSHPVWVRGLK